MALKPARLVSGPQHIHKSMQASLEAKVPAVRDAPEIEVLDDGGALEAGYDDEDSDDSVAPLITKVWLLVL